MATKLLLKEWKDKAYPIVHIDPDYYSLIEDPEFLRSGDGDPFSKINEKVPFLKTALPYPQLDKKKFSFGKTVFAAPAATNQKFAVLELENKDEEMKAFIVYDISQQHPPNMMYHPIAVIKNRQPNGVRFTQNGYIVTIEQKEGERIYNHYGIGGNLSDDLILPDLMTKNELYKRHFMFSLIYDKNKMDSETASNQYQCTQQNGVCDCPGIGKLSLSLNVTRARTINEINSKTLDFADQISKRDVYDRLMSSASRQASVLCGMSIDDFKYGQNPDEAFTDLQKIVSITNNDLYAQRHICLAWCILFVYYTKMIGLPAPNEAAGYRFRSQILGMILDDEGWIMTTSVDLGISSPILENVLYHLLYSLSKVQFSSNGENSNVELLDEILAEQLKTSSIEMGTLKPHTLDANEQDKAAQFSFQATQYEKIFTSVTGIQDRNPQSLATTLENKPYYCGAYAAEIDRIAKAYATNEIACVPLLRPGEFTGYECTKNVSLDRIPAANDHPHPVAEYFNSGMVVTLADLLRDGHTVRVVPYLQNVINNANDSSVLPWPLRPAMEITFASGRTYYQPAEIVWLRYTNLHLNRRPGSVTIDSVVAFARDLIKRAKLLYYLPAITLVTTTENGEVTVERSHDASEPPIAIITALNSGLIKVAATLYREEVSNNKTADVEDVRRATSRILSEFSGFCPTTWKISGSSPRNDNDLCYMMERICLGMHPTQAEIGSSANMDSFKRVLGANQLFGIPE